MVYPLNKSPLKVGLALSGGGYRAAAFHLGTLRKLSQLTKLDCVDVLSTVSGGSIVGASYVLERVNQTFSYSTFEQSFISKLKTSVISSVLTSITFISILVITILLIVTIIYFQFTKYTWMSWVLLGGSLFLLFKYQFKIFQVSKIIERIYDKIFFNGSTLGNLPCTPEIVINSTNLETGRPFTFSLRKMNDSTYEYLREPVYFRNIKFPISRAVMASSCVPFAFTPVLVDQKYFYSAKDAKRVKPRLIDGGVYDNQGIHKLTFDKSSHSCDIVIVSDAGDKMPSESVFPNVFGLLIRTMDLFMNRIKKFQMMENLYQPGSLRKREIGFVSLGWDLEKCIPDFVLNMQKGNILPHVISHHSIPSNLLNPFDTQGIQAHLEQRVGYSKLLAQKQSSKDLVIARNVSTNLTALKQIEINSLINQAELMTELQIKLYCPSL